jgi:hypothetical protein
MCEYGFISRGEAGKVARRPEQPPRDAAADLVESLIAALVEARLAVGALTVSLGSQYSEKDLES